MIKTILIIIIWNMNCGRIWVDVETQSFDSIKGCRNASEIIDKEVNKDFRTWNVKTFCVHEDRVKEK